MKAPPFKISSHTVSSFLSFMASTTAPQASYSPLPRKQNGSQFSKEHQLRGRVLIVRKTKKVCFGVFAAQEGPRKQRRAPPGVDTRIHWDNPDEGWIGVSSSSQQTKQQLNAEQEQKNLLGEKFADLLNYSSDSHYQFLGISADADLEEIKAAYRRLSKEYHPDTTSLPLKAASDKFLKLREVYDVLSNEEKRRFYDWTLAQEAASRQAEKMRMNLRDPYELEVKNWESVPDMVDRLGGRNMKLSDQAASAITIDIFIIVLAICCIIYVMFFIEPNY